MIIYIVKIIIITNVDYNNQLKNEKEKKNFITYNLNTNVFQIVYSKIYRPLLRVITYEFVR